MKRNFSFVLVVFLVCAIAPFAMAEDSPRIKCLTKCSNELIACLKDAGKDETKKSACNKEVDSCQKVCPAPDANPSPTPDPE